MNKKVIQLTHQSINNRFNFIQPPIPKPIFRMLVIGPSGSGKTNNILNMICRFWIDPNKQESIFSKIYVISQSLMTDDSFKVITEYIDNNKLFMTNQLSMDLINEIMNDEESKDKLVYIDDYAAFKKQLKDESLLNLFFTGRHNKISIILTSQQYQQIPTPLRVNATHIIVYEPLNQSINYIRQENETMKHNGADFINMMQYACSEKYNFLLIDKSKGSPIFYKNYDEEL